MASLPYVIPYDPEFLGSGFTVPLPKTASTDDGRALEAHLLSRGAVYDYIHYSLVMHKERRQALFTGCNLDGDEQKQVPRGSWSIDRRLPDYQIGNEAYQDTPGHPNPWDRGHLVRRQDVCWGDRTRAKQASDSTFFYTNSSFQHHNFNGDEWNQLEDWVLERVTEAAPRLCVLTGQFLTDEDPEYTVNPGIRVRIPTAFWKVIVLRDPTDGGEDLTAAAFIIPQSAEFIRTVGRQDATPWTKEQLRTYQVEIADLEQLSHLDFGELRNVDDFPWSAVRRRFRTDKMWDAWRPISEPADIALGGTRRRRLSDRRALRVASNRTSISPATGVVVVPQVLHRGTGEPLPTSSGSGASSSTNHTCGCGTTPSLEQQVSLMQLKVDQLTNSLAEYAVAKVSEAQVVAASVDEATDAKPTDAAEYVSAKTKSSLTSALKTQAVKDRARAERLVDQITRIVGGTPTQTAEYPSCVLIGDGMGFFCTGVLISERVVLTAAHCYDNADQLYPTRVLAGVVDQGQAVAPSAQPRNVLHIVRQPQYLQTRLPWNDLMLLILDQAVVVNSQVRPVEIVPQTALAGIQDVTIVGFGNSNTAATIGFGRQRKAKVSLTNTFDASQWSDGNLRDFEEVKGFSAPREFFAGRNNSNIDTCTGDSGGPVYAEVGGQTRLLGITSRAADEGDAPCGDGGLYTTVVYYSDWIQNVRTRYGV